MAGSVSVAQAFTSLAIISLLNMPLASLLSSIPSFAASLGSFGRIQEYLLSIERLDARKFPESSSTEALPQNKSMDDTELQPLKLPIKPQIQDSRSLGRNSMLSLENCSFGKPQILNDISLQIPQSSVSMIIGPIGSGKSMLLKAMIGELPLTKGILQIGTREVAYCSQDPWLVNTSLKRNILGPAGDHEKDMAWYRTVTNACGLDADIPGFTEGDELVVGSGGIRLSGGQRQRVVWHPFPCSGSSR